MRCAGQSFWKNITNSAMLRWDRAIAELPPGYYKLVFRRTKQDWLTSEQRPSADLINPHNGRQYSDELYNPNPPRY